MHTWILTVKLHNQHLILGPIVITSGTAGPPGNDQIHFFCDQKLKKVFAYHCPGVYSIWLNFANQ